MVEFNHRAASDFWMSAYKQDLRKMRGAIAAGADCNRTLGPELDTALHVACDKGWVVGMELLLASGANPHAVNKFGFTPLHGAAGSGQHRPVEIMLAHGADLNARSSSGYTPLLAAAMAQTGGAARALLKAGANPMPEDVSCYDDLHPVFAAARMGRVQSLAALMDASEDVVRLLQTDEFWEKLRSAIGHIVKFDEHRESMMRTVTSHLVATNIESAMPGGHESPSRTSGGFAPL